MNSISISALVLFFTVAIQAAEPIKLHPNNPRYFQWRGKPTLLITSAEHYGAVLNADFDYVKYLDALAKDGLNLTRIFTGAYCEHPAAFNITSNTLAPAPGRLLAPWARSDTPGYANNGGNKFDLTKWDAAYFRRLKDFVAQASTRGVVVEVTLFCPFYKDDMWALSPMNAANNINGLGDIARTNVHTLDRHGGLLAVQEAMVRKLVAELRDADNVIWEICNEPYFGGVMMEWQHRIVDVIVETERQGSAGVSPANRRAGGTPALHLIAQNIANGRKKIENPHPAVSVFNFHYASPPDTVALNWALNKPIGDDETGFKGTGDAHYRMEAWEFILAGGALYNNLDYSFAVGHEAGTFRFPGKQPGGGGPTIRRHMKVLKDFMDSFEFIRMKPDKSFIKSPLQEGQRVSAMSEPGRQYALYFNGGDTAALTVDLPKGGYKVEWVCELTCEIEQREELTNHPGGPVALKPKKYKNEITLRILAK